MTAPESSHERDIRAQLDALRRGAAVYSDRPEPMISVLRAVASQLMAATTPASRELRAELRTSTGLSAPMIEWALTTTLTSLVAAPLEELTHALPPQPQPGELIGVVLAGNIFTAAVRGIGLPLLAGAHVIVKAKHGDSVLARALQRALCDADPTVGARLAITEFNRADAAATHAFCEQLSALSIYGGDDTVTTLSHFASASCRIIPHGHGVSAAYVSKRELTSESAATHAAERIALDVAAYDQRGCLSPQFVCVQTGATVSPSAFAAILANQALPKWQALLPAGQPTPADHAARMQWQAAAAVRGELHAHPHHAVSYEADLTPRPSEGGRLVAVHACPDLAALRAQLAPLSQHLKCVGVAGSREDRDAVRTLLDTFSTAYACRSGEMQTPPFDAIADGRPPFAGLTPR